MIKKVAAVAAAAGGLVLAGAGIASADQVVQGSAANSAGVISGNNIQVPVNAPIDVCGNTVNVVGALNPASGVSCNDN